MTFMGLLKRVTAQVGLEQGLGLKSTSATQAIPYRFWPSHGPLNFHIRNISSLYHPTIMLFCTFDFHHSIPGQNMQKFPDLW